jgi:uncharacterized cupredoxin-like copper-binding protein
LLVAALIAVVLVTACSSDKVLPARSMTVVGTEMAFAAPDQVASGDYKVTFRNAGTVYHELAFKDSSGKFLVRRSIAAGQTVVLSVKLPAGTYELGCFEPGHYAMGMHKMLTVTDTGSS